MPYQARGRPTRISCWLVRRRASTRTSRAGPSWALPVTLLQELLSHAGLTREQVFITNTVKCRPLNNRDPLPGEMAACRKYLDRQLEVISPKVIVTLGRYSLASFLPGEAIGKARGRPRSVNGTTVYPVYHPAAALRQQALRKVLEEDMQKLPGLLSAAPEPQEGPQEEQLSMF